VVETAEAANMKEAYEKFQAIKDHLGDCWEIMEIYDNSMLVA
jgi:hypothetical protein